MRRPGVEPVSCWSQVQRPNHYTTEPPIGIAYRSVNMYANWQWCRNLEVEMKVLFCCFSLCLPLIWWTKIIIVFIFGLIAFQFCWFAGCQPERVLTLMRVPCAVVDKLSFHVGQVSTAVTGLSCEEAKYSWARLQCQIDNTVGPSALLPFSVTVRRLAKVYIYGPAKLV